MGSIIAVTNQKGGVGKTTTAINLAASLAASERRVLLIDGDPQGNASSGIGLTPDAVQSTLYDVLIDGRDPREAVRRAVHFPTLDVLAATPDLAGAEVELVGEVGRELVLRRAIDSIREDYDFVLIDCPPSLGLLTVNMLSAADSLIIPLQCEYFALEGLTQLLRTVNLVQQRLNSDLQVFGVLLTMYDARLNLSRQVADDAREHFGNLVFDTVIPRNIRLAEAPSFGRPIVTYDIASVGSAAYLSLAKEVIERSGMHVSDAPAATPLAASHPGQLTESLSATVRPDPGIQSPTEPDTPIRPPVAELDRTRVETETENARALDPSPGDYSARIPGEEAPENTTDQAPPQPQDVPPPQAANDPVPLEGDQLASLATEQEEGEPDFDPISATTDGPADQQADQIEDRVDIRRDDNTSATTAP